MPEIQALPEEDLVPYVLVDVLQFVATVLGSLPEIRELRPVIVQNMRGFDLESFDKLEAYACGLMDAHAGVMIARGPAEALDDATQEGSKLRDVFANDAAALVQNGHLDKAAVVGIRGVAGPSSLARDLSAYASAFLENWRVIRPHVHITRADLNRAVQICENINRARASHARAQQELAEALDVRQRVYTLALRTYHRVRQTAARLGRERYYGVEIAPSLCRAANKQTGRRSRRWTYETASNGSLRVVPPLQSEGDSRFVLLVP